MSELTERLRKELSEYKKDSFSLRNREAVLGAAVQDGPAILDEIDRLTAEVERLKIDREASGIALRDMHSRWDTAIKRALLAEAETDELADAVEVFLKADEDSHVGAFHALEAALLAYRGEKQ